MKIRTTAIMNLKGGVAKTTTTVNMAAILARDYGAKVLVIDADSQCNTTEFFGVKSAFGNLSFILRQPPAARTPFGAACACVQFTDYEGISIIAGDESLMDLMARFPCWAPSIS